MKPRLKQLGKDSLIYGLSSVLSKALSFITLPIFTAAFSPEEYGVLGTINLVAGILGALLNVGMDSALSMFFVEKDDQESKRRVVGSIFQWNIFWGLLLTITTILLIPQIKLYYGDTEENGIFYVIVFVTTFLRLFNTQAQNVYRLTFQSKRYVFFSLSREFIAVGLNLVFVLVFHLPIYWLLVSGFMISISYVVPIWYPIRDYLKFDLSLYKMWPKLLKFGLPLFPQAFALYLIISADRWTIQYFQGIDALGLYTIGAKMTMFVALATRVFRQAWLPIVLDAIKDEGDKPFLRLVTRGYFGLGMIAVVGYTGLAKEITMLLTDAKFHETYAYSGVLTWYAIIYGGINIVGIGAWKMKKTLWLTFALVVFAGANIVLNLVLVPEWSNMGAAIASAISSVLYINLLTFISERQWAYGANYFKLNLQFALAAIASYFILTYHELFLIRMGIVLAAVMAIFFTIGSLKEIKSVIKMVLKKKRI